MENSTWQKCPICDGKGGVPPSGITINSTEECPTCRGKRIISMLTGNPPGGIGSMAIPQSGRSAMVELLEPIGLDRIAGGASFFIKAYKLNPGKPDGMGHVPIRFDGYGWDVVVKEDCIKCWPAPNINDNGK